MPASIVESFNCIRQVAPLYATKWCVPGKEHWWLKCVKIVQVDADILNMLSWQSNNPVLIGNVTSAQWSRMACVSVAVRLVAKCYFWAILCIYDRLSVLSLVFCWLVSLTCLLLFITYFIDFLLQLWQLVVAYRHRGDRTQWSNNSPGMGRLLRDDRYFE